MTLTAKRPPGPKGGLFSGLLNEITQDRLGFFTRYKAEWGNIYRLDFRFASAVVISEPALLQEILVTQNKKVIKQDSLRRSKPLLGLGLLTSEGDFWLRQRRLAQPGFHRERIAGYSQVMVDYTLSLIEPWQDGALLDLNREMMALTLAIVAKTLFNGEITPGTASEVGSALTEALHLWDQVTLTNPLLDYLPTPKRIRWKRAIARLDAVVNQIIQGHKAKGIDQGDLLSMLMAARDEDGSGMTDKQLRDEVMTIFLAGHETTANNLTWTFHLLAQHPEVVAKLEAEVDQVLGERAPTMADLPHLPYTEMVINESLRLFPPAWMIGREPIEDLQIGEYLISKGESILMPIYILHRDERTFPEPEAFRPERWADGLAKRIHPYAYIPFSSGPRICIGKEFAKMEAILLLATIVQSFRFTPEPDKPVEFDPSITLRPKSGLWMRLQKR